MCHTFHTVCYQANECETKIEIEFKIEGGKILMKCHCRIEINISSHKQHLF